MGNDVFNDPWMDEALATYSSMIYFKAERGTGGYQGILSYYQQRYDNYLQTGQDDLVTASVAHYENLGDNGRAYGAVVYAKGALFYDALFNKVGETAFFDALKAYYQKEKFQIAQPQDLLNAFDQASGKSLEGFYQEWLYSAKP